MKESQKKLDVLNEHLKLTPSDYVQFLKDERAYLLSRQTEPVEDIKNIEYIERLEKYWLLG